MEAPCHEIGLELIPDSAGGGFQPATPLGWREVRPPTIPSTLPLS